MGTIMHRPAASHKLIGFEPSNEVVAYVGEYIQSMVLLDVPATHVDQHLGLRASQNKLYQAWGKSLPQQFPCDINLLFSSYQEWLQRASSAIKLQNCDRKGESLLVEVCWHWLEAKTLKHRRIHTLIEFDFTHNVQDVFDPSGGKQVDARTCYHENRVELVQAHPTEQSSTYTNLLRAFHVTSKKEGERLSHAFCMLALCCYYRFRLYNIQIISEALQECLGCMGHKQRSTFKHNLLRWQQALDQETNMDQVAFLLGIKQPPLRECACMVYSDVSGYFCSRQNVPGSLFCIEHQL